MDQLIGIPYAEKGRDQNIGLDCWGLFRVFYQQFMGIELPSFADTYQSALDHQAMAEAMNKHLPSQWIRVSEPEFGDGVRLRIDGNPCHVAVYVGNGQILHTQTGHDSALDRLDSVRWKNRIEGFYRHISIAGEGV